MFLAPEAVPRITLTKPAVNNTSKISVLRSPMPGPGTVAPSDPTLPNIRRRTVSYTHLDSGCVVDAIVCFRNSFIFIVASRQERDTVKDSKALIEEAIRLNAIEGVRHSIEVARRLDPEIAAASIEVAGGLVAFAGVDSPLSRALGVGVRGPVSTSDIAKITEFYESRGATPMVFVTPTADPSLMRELTGAGYAPGDREQSLLASAELFGHAQRDERIGVARDLASWARSSAAAFLEREALELSLIHI